MRVAVPLLLLPPRLCLSLCAPGRVGPALLLAALALAVAGAHAQGWICE